MDEDRFQKARSGDMLCVEFQCDVCWFLNLKKRLPNQTSLVDKLLLPYIRRVNLDIMWSRKCSTVVNNYRVTMKRKNAALELGLKPQFEPRGPWPISDGQGFQTALEMVRQSREPGKNDKLYQQLDTIRKFRTVGTNEYESSPSATNDVMFIGDGGQVFRTTTAPTQSKLFARFMRGCEKRMGRLVIQNKALDIKILQRLLLNYELELLSTKTSASRKRWIKVVTAYFVISYVGALRGSEGLMLEATSLAKYIDEGRNEESPYVLATLLGRFKGETGERNVMLPLAATSKSGIKTRVIVDRLVEVLKKEGKTTGELAPAICHTTGLSISRTELNNEFISELEKIQESHPQLIAKAVDVAGTYNIYRSLRRGATSRATAVGLGQPEIERNNRWRKFQTRSGSMPRMRMHDVYIDIKLALNSYLLFSSSL